MKPRKRCELETTYWLPFYPYASLLKTVIVLLKGIDLYQIRNMESSKRLGCFGYRFMKVISRLSGSIIRNMKSWDVFLPF